MSAACDAMPPVSASDTIRDALIAIARGRSDCGRPLAGEVARQASRRALTAIGVDWRVTGDVGRASRRDVRNAAGHSTRAMRDQPFRPRDPKDAW